MIVVDASIVIKWFFEDEEDSIDALDLYEKHAKKIEKIVVPQIVFYEMANVLATKSEVKSETIIEDINFIYKANLVLHQETRDELVEAAILAKDYKTSIYDMLYAVVAKNKKCILVTADDNFVKKTKFKHIKLLEELEKTKTHVQSQDTPWNVKTMYVPRV